MDLIDSYHFVKTLAILDHIRALKHTGNIAVIKYLSVRNLQETDKTRKLLKHHNLKVPASNR